jgi:hypothetical protein
VVSVGWMLLSGFFTACSHTTAQTRMAEPSSTQAPAHQMYVPISNLGEYSFWSVRAVKLEMRHCKKSHQGVNSQLPAQISACLPVLTVYSPANSS